MPPARSPSGVPVGVPDGSPAASADFRIANAATLALDAVAVVLAWVLSSVCGLRLPPSLVLVPGWVGVGFLAPVVAVLPVGSVRTLVTSGQVVDLEGGLVEDWAYTTVYGSFFVQGVALIVLLGTYVRSRWGSALHALAAAACDLTWFDRFVAFVTVTVAAGVGATHWFEAFVAPSGWHNSEWTFENRFVSGVMGCAALSAAAAIAYLTRGGSAADARRRAKCYVAAHVGCAVMFAYGLLHTFSIVVDVCLSDLTPVPERLLYFAALLAGMSGAAWLANLPARSVGPAIGS